jgi:hypothetical protein
MRHQAVFYDVFPEGADIAGVVRWHGGEGYGEFVVEATGRWRRHFKDQGVSISIPVSECHGIRLRKG